MSFRAQLVNELFFACAQVRRRIALSLAAVFQAGGTGKVGSIFAKLNDLLKAKDDAQNVHLDCRLYVVKR
jgi:hypothetical protein